MGEANLKKNEQASSAFLSRTREGVGFFRALQSYFVNKLDGRYMGLILEEIGNREPESMLSVLAFSRPPPRLDDIRKALDAGELHFKREYLLPNGQRADLAILRKETPLALVEIKVNDRNAPGNEKQLTGYEEFIRKTRRCHFFTLAGTDQISF
jgi:hypothetical protein